MSTTEAKVVDATDQGGVTTEVRDRVMLIGIDRPRKRNALTPKIISALSDAYARFDKDDDLRCALLFGHGAVFCAGYDLTLLKDAVADGMAYGGDAYDPFGLTGRRLSKPLVVAIHGACLAGGLEVALNGDVIVAAERTLFGQPEVTRGLFAFGGGAIRWLQRTSWGNAQVHLLTGDSITAEEAYRIGLTGRARRSRPGSRRWAPRPLPSWGHQFQSHECRFGSCHGRGTHPAAPAPPGTGWSRASRCHAG